MPSSRRRAFNRANLKTALSRSTRSLGKSQRWRKRKGDAHIQNLENMIEEKLQLVNINQAREVDLYEIEERAIQDNDLSEKNWRKIFLTHIFVSKMLRNKIEKEMEKFKVVEMVQGNQKTCQKICSYLLQTGHLVEIAADGFDSRTTRSLGGIPGAAQWAVSLMRGESISNLKLEQQGT